MGLRHIMKTPSPEESKKLILLSLESYSNSTEPFLEKLSKLIQNIYNAHAFFDGNKRMTRLLIANQLLSNGYPFAVLHKTKNEYNEALMEGFVNQTYKPILDVLVKTFNQFLTQQIEVFNNSTKPNSKGFGLIL